MAHLNERKQLEIHFGVRITSFLKKKMLHQISDMFSHEKEKHQHAVFYSLRF